MAQPLGFSCPWRDKRVPRPSRFCFMRRAGFADLVLPIGAAKDVYLGKPGDGKPGDRNRGETGGRETGGQTGRFLPASFRSRHAAIAPRPLTSGSLSGAMARSPEHRSGSIAPVGDGGRSETGGERLEGVFQAGEERLLNRRGGLENVARCCFGPQIKHGKSGVAKNLPAPLLNRWPSG
jgi:hypothetical protein